MAANLFKPEAERQRNRKDVRDAIISIFILILFIVAVIYVGIVVGNMEGNK